MSEHPPVVNGLLPQAPDNDPAETAEWVESLSDLINEKGGPRARYILLNMLAEARKRDVQIPQEYTTPYINTIPVDQEPYFPGDEAMERQYRRWIRWNAAVMVTRAQRPGVKVGGHISSYASVSTLYEVGLNHFFRGKHHPGGGDHIFFQGHSSPGQYARAFLEGRLTAEELDSFRQQASTSTGLPSYPHPRQMPDFWEYPTVSLGLGPAAAIYQAWFDRYLHLRGLKDTSQQHTWAFIGDGEMDEPECRGMLQLAAQQGLDNLTFVINCNLQRLDGPVRGNGKIIQELEAFFKGAGWNVIKVIWGRGWDQLLAADKDNALVNLMNETLDGDYQTFKANDGGYVREHFFARDPRTKNLVQNWTDDQIWALQRGGNDYRKVYAAYKAAMDHTGQPTVILAHTVKGYALGSSFAGRNSTHQMKKLTLEDSKRLRDRLELPITDAELERDPYAPPYYMPPADHPALLYMKERREKLGGFLPERRSDFDPKLPTPDMRPFEGLSKGSGKLEVATTMAFVRMLKDLIKDKNMGRYLVPIIPDEARTFGLDAIFPSAKLFHTHGQNYTPVDADMMLSYKESQQGQVLHTGITEAGSAAAFQVVGTAYQAHNLPMVPIYILYSMFGFQRTGDQFWAAADMLARGFVIGATAGRTTLTGEGLQHLDGHSPLMSATNHGFITYDPAYAYEIRHIMWDGLQRMYGENDPRDPNVMYYITVYNEPYQQPAEPENLDVDGLLRGIYKVEEHTGHGPKVQLLASGVGVPWVREARRMLAEDWGVDAAVWSVTSWGELRRDGREVDEFNMMNPDQQQRTAYITQKLAGVEGPIIATSDYDTMVQDLIRPWVPGEYVTLGADGFGISDTRRAARRHFKIDAESVVVQTLRTLAARGQVDPGVVAQAIAKYDLHNNAIEAAGPVGDTVITR